MASKSTTEFIGGPDGSVVDVSPCPRSVPFSDVFESTAVLKKFPKQYILFQCYRWSEGGAFDEW